MLLKNLGAAKAQILTKVVRSSWYDHVCILLRLNKKEKKGWTVCQCSGTQSRKLS